MMTILLLVCLTADPTDCKEEDLRVEMPVQACGLFAQMPIAEWKAGHPKWSVKRWRCTPIGTKST